MLGQRRRRWTNIKLTLGQGLVFDVMYSIPFCIIRVYLAIRCHRKVQTTKHKHIIYVQVIVTAAQSQNVVSAYFPNKELLPFGSREQISYYL